MVVTLEFAAPDKDQNRGKPKRLSPDIGSGGLRDQDTGDCHVIKQSLIDKCNAAGRPDALVRIACSELESWYLGDLAAIETALSLTNLSRHQRSSKFRNPDILGNAAQELDQLTKGVYQKVGGSREIGKHLSLDIVSNRSTSFRVFVEGLSRIVRPYAGDQGAT